MSERVTSLNACDVERDELPVDVLVVGGGPAGLACAIDVARRFQAAGETEKTVLVIDKAEELGHHTLSGAVMKPEGIAALGDGRVLVALDTRSTSGNGMIVTRPA